MRTASNKNPDSREANRAHRTLQKILRDAKQKTSVQNRQALFKNVTDRVKRLVEKYQNIPILKSAMNKIRRAMPDMFRFVLDPRIPPDNNPAERMLRELVVHRKIRVSLRSEKTMEWMGYLFSCVSTWKNLKIDHVAEITKYA